MIDTEKLKQSYKNQLIKAGVDLHKAERVAINLTREELQLIHEIWPEWAAVLARTEAQTQASLEMFEDGRL